MMKILTVFGTRPEVIKMAPVIKELNRYPDSFECLICITGQHRQMIDHLLKLFQIHPDYDLSIMKENQSLEYITAEILTKFKDVLNKEKPDYLFIQGDTTTAMAASLAAFYQRVKIGHIEAGLRTWDKYQPYPEEVNRKIIDSVTDLFFAHSQKAKQNLINEGIAENNIEVTGNTVIDALLDIAQRENKTSNEHLTKIISSGKKIILVTAHRRESFGGPLLDICNAIKEVASKFTSEIDIVYPVHLNPNVQNSAFSILNKIDNIHLIEPLEYDSFVHLMKRSYFILTDSGGIQEEAPSLGKPVLVLRDVTERPEAVEAGAVEVVGTKFKKIVEKTTALIQDKEIYNRMAKCINPYGDGKASKRIVARLLKEIE